MDDFNMRTYIGLVWS